MKQEPQNNNLNKKTVLSVTISKENMDFLDEVKDNFTMFNKSAFINKLLDDTRIIINSKEYDYIVKLSVTDLQ
jgi:hypothetical protein